VEYYSLDKPRLPPGVSRCRKYLRTSIVAF